MSRDRAYLYAADVLSTARIGWHAIRQIRTTPEVTTLNLVVDDEGDVLEEEEREALNAHLAAAWRSAQAGNVRAADELLVELRRRR
jgi:hypothetical protein